MLRLLLLLSCPLVATFAVDSIESCFVFFPYRYLERSGNAIIRNLSDARECQYHCLMTRLRGDMPCKSAMWKRDTVDCVLSRYNRFDRYESYRIAPNLEIDYFENICIGKEKLFSEMPEEQIDVEGGRMDEEEQRTTVRPRVEKLRGPKRRSIGMSPPVSFHMDDPVVVVDKLALIRPGPVTKHYYFASTKPIQTTTTNPATSTTSPPPPPHTHTPPPPPLPMASPLVAEAPLIHRQLNCFTRRQNVVLKGFEEQTYTALSIAQCLQRCRDATGFFCASVNFELTRKLCVLNGGSASLNKVGLEPAAVDYFENNCVPRGTESQTTFVENFDRGCFLSRDNAILLDLNGDLLTTVSLEACMADCSRPSRRTRCAAINWLPDTRSCMLFSPGHSHHVVRHDSGSYHENRCVPIRSELPRASTVPDYDYH